MEFPRSFLRRQFGGKPVVASRNAGCFAKDFCTGPRAQQPLQSINQTFKKVSYMCAKRVKITSSDTKDKCQNPRY